MAAQELTHITLAALVAACRRETARFQRDEVSDSCYCLEIFHRALRFRSRSEGEVIDGAPIYNDEAAREELVLIYTEYILAQINRTAVPSHLHRELTQDVWRNFWQAANHGLVFPTLPAALAYLRQVTVSAIIKYRRARYQRAREESLQALVAQVGNESMISTTTDLFDNHARTRFRERCAEVLTESREYRIFWLRYGLGYTPQEIVKRLEVDRRIAGRPTTARKVSDILEGCFRRLSADPEIRALLQSD